MTTKAYEFIGKKIRPIEVALFFKKILFINRKFYKIKDIYWFLDPISNFGIRLMKDGYYDPDTTKLILEKLEDGDVFVDLGGNEGYFSILASEKVGINGKVYYIEPQERLWNVMAKNINKNHCYNVTIIPFAVSNTKNEVDITPTPSINSGSSTLVKENRGRLWKNQRINCTTLDDLFYKKTLKIVKLIKIDIEGFELFALKGGTKLLENKIIKNILIEFHPRQLKELGQSIQEIHNLLIDFGYKKENEMLYTCES